MLYWVNKNIYTFLISYSHLVQMQDQKDCSLDSWNCHKKWVHVTQSQELINRVPVLCTLHNLKPVMRINEQCTLFCFSFKVFVMRFQILKAARNAVTLLVTKRLLKVAQNQNISVKRSERSKVEAWARNPSYLPSRWGLGSKHPPKVQLVFLGWNSAYPALSWDLGTSSTSPCPQRSCKCVWAFQLFLEVEKLKMEIEEWTFKALHGR